MNEPPDIAEQISLRLERIEDSVAALRHAQTVNHNDVHRRLTCIIDQLPEPMTAIVTSPLQEFTCDLSLPS